MTQQLVTESPEKTQQHVEGRETSPAFAQSFQGGLHPVAQLQRTLGNRNVAKLIQAKRLTPEGKIIGLQRKLIVGAADDQYEQEADRVARQVMNTPDAVAFSSMQRTMSPEEDMDKMLQTKQLAPFITPLLQREMLNNEEPEDKEKPIQAIFLPGKNRGHLQRQPTAKEKAQARDDEAKVEAWLLEIWKTESGFDLEKDIHKYAGWHVLASKLRVRCRQETKAEPSVINAVWKRVTQGLEDKIVANLVAKPSIMVVEQWRRSVEKDFSYFESYEALTKFKDRVESQLLVSYSAMKVADAMKSSGYSTDKLKSLADIQIRQIIVNHRQDYFAAVSNGVNGWHAPRVAPDRWPSILSGASSYAGGVGSIVSLGTGAVVAAVAGPLLLVGIGLGIASAWLSIKAADEAHRQQLLEDAIRDETLRGFEHKVEMIEAIEDALAVVLVAEALKEGLDLKNIARTKLRAFCWKKMFGTFPEDQTKGRQEVLSAMHMELDGKLKG